MDNSEQYIKMCEKAFPDERPTAPIEGRVIEITQDDYFVRLDWYGHWWAGKDGKYIPLKTQDQLQEMVEFDPSIFNRKQLDLLMHEFHRFLMRQYIKPEGALYAEAYFEPTVDRFVNKSLDIFTSMEQLWLAFVEKENHGKVWDGETWVK